VTLRGEIADGEYARLIAAHRAIGHGVPDDPAPWRCELATIPPRQFMFGRMLQRGTVNMIAGRDNIVTTAVALSDLVGLAAGRNLLTGENIAPRRVWFLGAQEGQSEIDRQVAVRCSRFGISTGDIDGRLFAQSLAGRLLHVAAHGSPEAAHLRSVESPQRRLPKLGNPPETARMLLLFGRFFFALRFAFLARRRYFARAPSSGVVTIFPMYLSSSIFAATNDIVAARLGNASGKPFTGSSGFGELGPSGPKGAFSIAACGREDQL
jgi:hypothetical protein